MAYYSELAASQGLAGIIVVTNPPNMAPPGARAAGTHNSPIAIAVPGKNRPPISLDMATSVAAGGKLDVARDKACRYPSTGLSTKRASPPAIPTLSNFCNRPAATRDTALPSCSNAHRPARRGADPDAGPARSGVRPLWCPEQFSLRRRHRHLHRPGCISV